MYSLSLALLILFPVGILVWNILEGRYHAQAPVGAQDDADVEQLGLKDKLEDRGEDEDASKTASEETRMQASRLPLQSGRFGARLPLLLRCGLALLVFLCVAWASLIVVAGRDGGASEHMPAVSRGKVNLASNEEWHTPNLTQQNNVTLFGHEAHCNADDHDFLSPLIGHAQSFFQAGRDCGAQSAKIGWTIWWDWSAFQSCFSEVYPKLSNTCVACYNAQGKYGFSQCKWPCLTSWCSKECLECNAGFKEHLSLCVGMGEERPKAEQC
jgi:hypothetical protein